MICSLPDLNRVEMDVGGSGGADLRSEEQHQEVNIYPVYLLNSKKTVADGVLSLTYY
jgi:hypothetical protein